MKNIDLLPLQHSWPLYERARHFALARLDYGARFDGAAEMAEPVAARASIDSKVGRWECDLSDNSLTWSAEVYDIFGIARDTRVTRADAVALYGAESRATMERLRAYAIRHRRGFTVDVEIRPDRAEPRWMRLIAAPVCSGDAVVRLGGLKFLLPASRA